MEVEKQKLQIKIEFSEQSQDPAKLSLFYAQVLNIGYKKHQKAKIEYNLDPLLKQDPSSVLNAERLQSAIFPYVFENPDNTEQFFENNQEKIDVLFIKLEAIQKQQKKEKLYLDQLEFLLELCSLQILDLLFHTSRYDPAFNSDQRQKYFLRFLECFQSSNDQVSSRVFQVGWKHFPAQTKELLNWFFEHLLAKSVFKEVYDNVESQIQVLDLLKQIISAQNQNLHFFVGESGYFVSNQIHNGLEFQVDTILGRILSLSYFPTESEAWSKCLHDDLFDAYTTSKIENQVNAQKKNLSLILDKVVEIFKIIYRVDPESLINFLTYFCNLNKSKTQIYRIQLINSSNGLILNLTKIFLRLLRPFLKDDSEVQKSVRLLNGWELSVEGQVLRQKDRLVTGNAEGQEELQKEGGDPVFSKLVAGLVLLSNLAQYSFKFYGLTTPRTTDRSDLIQYAKRKFSHDIHFDDQEFIQLFLRFQSFYFQFLLGTLRTGLGDLENAKQSQLRDLPFLGARLPATYATQSNLFIEYNNRVLVFYTHYYEQLLVGARQHLLEVLNFEMLLMGKRALCENTHLRAKVLELFAQFLPDKEGFYKSQDFSFVFFENKVFLNFLLDSLIEIFNDCERTGSSNQFYDKYNYRLYFCKLLNFCICTSKTENYRLKLKGLLASDFHKMIQFSNYLINDVIYLIDEILEKIKQISQYEHQQSSGQMALELEDQAAGEEGNARQRYESRRSFIQVFGQFANYYVRTISEISQFSQDTFTSEALLDKLATGINYILYQLNAKETREQYEVKNPEELNFNLKLIVSTIIDIYLNLQNSPRFLDSVVQDKQYYSQRVFSDTVELQRERYTLDIEKVDRFRSVIEKLKEHELLQNRIDEILSSTDIPDEYIDPITGQIMRNPVRLPVSGKIVDLITIQKHLLNDATDPFNRQPLQLEQVVPQVELKAEISKFYQSLTKSEL